MESGQGNRAFQLWSLVINNSLVTARRRSVSYATHQRMSSSDKGLTWLGMSRIQTFFLFFDTKGAKSFALTPRIHVFRLQISLYPDQFSSRRPWFPWVTWHGFWVLHSRNMSVECVEYLMQSKWVIILQIEVPSHLGFRVGVSKMNLVQRRT